MAFLAYLGVGADGSITRELKTYVFVDPPWGKLRLVTARPQAATGQIDSRTSSQFLPRDAILVLCTMWALRHGFGSKQPRCTKVGRRFRKGEAIFGVRREGRKSSPVLKAWSSHHESFTMP